MSEIGRLQPGNLHRRLPRIIEAGLTHILLRQMSWRRRLAERLPHRKRKYSRGILSRELKALVEESDSHNPLLDTHFPDPLTAALLYDHAHKELPYLLHFGDAISMGHSVESRLPFLDHRLVEFVFSLPFDEKIRGSETKYILRRSFAADLPREIINRREKVGFPTPLGDWLEAHFHDDIRPLLTSQRVRERGIFDPAGLTNALDTFEKEQKKAERIFRCLAVERWFEIFIDGDGFR
jgi:asparagine synthetase B (glutamine-hydrolysing)